MQKNVGKIDRIIRLVVAAILIWQGFVISNLILILAGAVLLGTAIFSRCGLYKILGINTCKVK